MAEKNYVYSQNRKKARGVQQCSGEGCRGVLERCRDQSQQMLSPKLHLLDLI